MFQGPFLWSYNEPGEDLNRGHNMGRKIIILLLGLLAVYLLSVFFGHQLIRDMYEGKSLHILNGVISGQGVHPVEFYFNYAGMLLVKVFSLLLIGGILSICMSWVLENKYLEKHTDAIDEIPEAQIGLWIALAAGLSLFIELMIIRLHSSYFQLFAYFKNASLLSCFLGLGIGYARGLRRPLATPVVLPFLALQIVLMHFLSFNPIAKFLQNPISEQLGMGIDQINTVSHILICYGFLILIFAFNALCFIPLGHLASRLMMRRQNLVSYSWNLTGSLAGIILFSLISFIWAPPSIWIMISAAGLIAFFYREKPVLLLTIIVMVALLVFIETPLDLNKIEVHSPYQKLVLSFSKSGRLVLNTSNVYYQNILDLSKESLSKDTGLQKWAEYYELPYYFKPAPERVLIVGSGTGNDVASALRNRSRTVDAVEIDPVILRFGKELHPESPYLAGNVNAIVDDARAFIRRTENKYDLIVYGLLDSHTLLSGRSGGIRLDSYVYTVEAFREARGKLKKDGLMCLTFCIISPELGRKLFLMLQEAFDGIKPVVYAVGYDGGYAFLTGNDTGNRALYQHPTFREMSAEFDDSKIKADRSTDDWPFFYMPVKKYPYSYLLMVLILFAVSIIYVRRFIPGGGSGFSIPCFFLGAGFMLIEAKGITELALVYGSTWSVISIVVACILVMAFLANLLVMKKWTLSPIVIYSLIFASLILGFASTFTNFIGFSPWVSRMIMPVLLTLPLFFSGLAFSAELRKSGSIAVILSSNLLGAMLGGFLEYNSMCFGFRSLYVFAATMYGFAFLGAMLEKVGN